MSHPPLFSPEDSFDLTIKTLLTPGSALSYTFVCRIQALLIQFRLAPRVEVSDILTEAYLRGKAKLAKGEPIYQPSAWLKRVCFNIVFEQSRELRRQEPTAPELLELYSKTINDSWISNDLLEIRLAVLFDAFSILKRQDPDSAELLELKECQGLKWSEVRECLLDRGKPVPDIETLRQRGCRARKQLRRIFHETEKASA